MPLIDVWRRYISTARTVGRMSSALEADLLARPLRPMPSPIRPTEPCPFNTIWTLEEAIDFSRFLWNELRPIDWHCGLTGSVLYRGWSTKDLDMIIYPRNSGRPQRETVNALLAQYTAAAKVVTHNYDEGMREIWCGFMPGDVGAKPVEYFFLDAGQVGVIDIGGERLRRITI